MKTVLIAGGAGFIGSHLCKKLLEGNKRVICLDNFYTGAKENIENLLNNPNFEFIEHDVIEPFEKKGIDEIYNLACPASPYYYQNEPIKTAKASFCGTLNLLEIAKRNNAKILQASTSEIYGNPLCHPQKESYFGNVNPIGPRSCYDEGKRIAETLMSDYKRQYGTDARIARIFNTYGPNMRADDGRVISNFIVQALKNKEITIYGDGSQTRSFCYVSDMVEGLVKMMESKTPPSTPINLGNPCEKTILELAQIIIKITDSNSKITYRNLPEDDPVKRKPDITLAQKELFWEPKISLEEGLKKTITHFQNKIITTVSNKY